MSNTVKTGDTMIDSKSVAPIERTPDDILLQIFALSASYASDLSYSDAFLYRASLTCRTWRRLALSPALRAKFTLTLDEEGKASPAVIASKVLERSEQCPLSIRCIITNFHTHSIHVLRCRAAISRLVEQSYRWKAFACSVPTSKFDAQYSPVLTGFPPAASGASYPLLEHLEFSGCQVPSYYFEGEFTNSFLCAPRLQSFHFQTPSPSIHAPTIHSLQWNNLVRYTCSYHDRDVLQRCVNLKTYIINSRGTRSDQVYRRPEDHPQVSNPSVIHLPHLMEISTDDPNTLLGCILPSLSDLSCYIEPPIRSYDNFLRTVSQSRAILKRFFITWGGSPANRYAAVQDSEDNFNAFLSALHETCGGSLEILSIRLRGQRGLDQLCMILMSFVDTPGSFPNLRELRIWVSTNRFKHGYGKEWEHLIPNVITSRTRLRVLDVTFTPQGKPKRFRADELSKLVSRDTVEKVPLALLATQCDVKVTVQSKHNGRRWSCI